MAKSKAPDPKVQSLRSLGALNPHPDKVIDPLFCAGDFFDARDLVQVKYEMVRRVGVDGQSVSGSAKVFGFSRPAFYQAQAALNRGGIAELIPKKRGPRRRHKLSAQVLEFLRIEKTADPSLRSPELACRVREHFGIDVHSRSIERASSQIKKKRF
jgi:transposase